MKMPELFFYEKKCGFSFAVTTKRSTFASLYKKAQLRD
jgi:hypothetical protein